MSLPSFLFPWYPLPPQSRNTQDFQSHSPEILISAPSNFRILKVLRLFGPTNPTNPQRSPKCVATTHTTSPAAQKKSSAAKKAKKNTSTAPPANSQPSPRNPAPKPKTVSTEKPSSQSQIRNAIPVEKNGRKSKTLRWPWGRWVIMMFLPVKISIWGR